MTDYSRFLLTLWFYSDESALSKDKAHSLFNEVLAFRDLRGFSQKQRLRY